jgi:hypothetical protein
MFFSLYNNNSPKPKFMPKKQVLIIIVVLAVSAFSLPFLSNSDLFKGALTISESGGQNCIVLGSNRKVILDTATVNNREIPVYRDALDRECTDEE